MSFSLKNLFANASKILAGNLGITALGFFQGVLVARAFGPSNYGVWGLIVAYCGTVKAFLSFRTSEPLTRYLVEYHKNKDTKAVRLLLDSALMAEIATSLISLAIIMVAAPLAAKGASLGGKAILAAWIFAFGQTFAFITPVYYSVIRNKKKFNQIAMLPFASACIQLLIVSVLHAFGRLDIESLAWSYLASAALQFLFNLAILRREVSVSYGMDIFKMDPMGCWRDRKDAKGFWAFMGTTYLSSMATSLFKNGDTLLLGHFALPAQVGLYKLAKNLAALLNSSATSLGSVIYQDFNELIMSGKTEELFQGLKRLMKIWLPIVAGGAVVSIACSGWAVPLVFGKSYAGSQSLFGILMAGMAVATAFFWIQPLALSCGQFGAYLRVVVILSLAALPLMAYSGMRAGSVGVAVAYGSSWAFIHIALLAVVTGKVRANHG